MSNPSAPPIIRDLSSLPRPFPEIPGPRFRVWWKGTEVLAVQVGDETQEWRRTDAGFRRMQ